MTVFAAAAVTRAPGRGGHTADADPLEPAAN